MDQATQNRTALTPDEFDELIDLFDIGNKNFSPEQYTSARWVHPLDPRPHTGVTHLATADVLFKCKTCTDISEYNGIGENQWYQIILDTIGGSIFLHGHTSEDDVRAGYNGKNLSKILNNDEAVYTLSVLNLIKGTGYVCDHCRDSIFEDG